MPRGPTATRAGMPTRRSVATEAAAAAAAATEAPAAQSAGGVEGPSGAARPATSPASPASFAAVVMGSFTRGLKFGTPEYQAAVEDLTRKMVASREASAADRAAAARDAVEAAVRAGCYTKVPIPVRPPWARPSRSPQHSGETPDQQRRRLNVEGGRSAAPSTRDLDADQWPQLQQQGPPAGQPAIRMAPNPYGALDLDDPGHTSISQMETQADQ